MSTFARSTAAAARWLPAVALTLTVALHPGAAVAAAAGTSPAAEATPDHSSKAPFRGGLTHEGIAVDVSIEPIDGATTLRQGDHARVRIRVEDTNTGKPLSALYPAAWMDRVPASGDSDENPCQAKVESFLGGSLLAQPEVDLNAFYVLALNDDRTVTIVDPLFGFGGSRLLAMLQLKARGQDWALTEDQQRLFIAMPEADEVAVATTLGWEVETNIHVGPGPHRLALQPDGAFLWVLFDGRAIDGGRRSGVSVVGTTAMKELSRIATGAGAHDLAFSGDNRFVYVANRDEGTVSVIDIAERRKVADVETGPRPISLAWSQAARALYVSDEVAGTVTAIDGESHEVVARMEAEPGLGQIRFAPGDRYALALVPTSNSVYVVDAAANRIIQHGEVEDGPDQVAFSDELAYVRHQRSEIMLTIPLDSLGAEGRPIQVIDFSGGTHPPGAGMGTQAAGMVQAPGAPAMLIANGSDSAIYFYKEGMAAPMGHFKNYGHRPRAVQVVDRSLQEVEPGVYETGIRLRRPGDYDLAFFLDTPRIVHCFPLRVEVDPEIERSRRAKVSVRPLSEPADLTVGEARELRFRALDPATGDPITGLDDLQVLTVRAPGTWHQRHAVREVEDGVYALDFAPPQAGIYYVYSAVESRGAGFNRNPFQIYRAVGAEATVASADEHPEDRP